MFNLLFFLSLLLVLVSCFFLYYLVFGYMRKLVNREDFFFCLFFWVFFLEGRGNELLFVIGIGFFFGRWWVCLIEFVILWYILMLCLIFIKFLNCFKNFFLWKNMKVLEFVLCVVELLYKENILFFFFL